MATTSVYLLKIPGNSAIEISQDELRSLLGEIETELYQSKIYRRALNVLQNMFGSSAEQAQALFKAVGREAIGLAFRQFVQHQQKAEEEAHQQAENSTESESENKEIVSIVKEADAIDLSECLTSIKTQQKATVETTDTTDSSSKSQFEVVKTTEENPTKKKQRRWLNRKPSKAELAEQKAQQRIESLHQIGQQLRQIRKSQGLTLNQLNVYTHVPIHQMEAVENGNWDLLPEEVYVRGFIRVMGNALGLNGTQLAASLPTPEPTKLVLPTSYQSQNNVGLGFGIKPVHLYLGYAALVAGSLGGLSIMSQQANADASMDTGEVPSSSTITQSSQDEKPTPKPGLQSSRAGVIVGNDMSRPETL